MNQPMTAPGALRSSGGEVMTRSTMSLSAHALQNGDYASSVRIVMMDTLPGGSEMEVTFDADQAVSFANVLREVAQAAAAHRPGAGDQESAAA